MTEHAITAITLFSEDLAASRQFYLDAFEAPVVFEDEVSCALRVGPTIVNLLQTSEAGELIEPAAVASAGSGSRVQFTIDVADVDAVIAELAERGVPLLNGPIDRPWGIRTATIIDPAGHVWELAAPLR